MLKQPQSTSIILLLVHHYPSPILRPMGLHATNTMLRNILFHLENEIETTLFTRQTSRVVRHHLPTLPQALVRPMILIT